METIVMQRRFDPPMDVAGFHGLVADAVGCLGTYRVTWLESFLAQDGSALVCCFRAPDTEAIRNVARGDSAIDRQVWRGDCADSGRDGLASVLVERRFDTAVALADLQAIEDAAADCLQRHRVTFLRTYHAADGRTLLCLYRAPDAESVRLAQRQAGMPLERAWACHHFTPDNLTG